jgi:hypothetical protein
MYLFYQFLYEYPYIAVAQGAVMIWMLVDAQQRRAEQTWFWVILFVPVVGAWAYFFAVKAADFRSMSPHSLFQPRASLEELRYRAEQTPTLANHLAYAELLPDRGEFGAARPHLEAAHKMEPEHSRVAYCLALCHAWLGHADAALPLLEKVVAREPRWSNYAAWRLLIDTRAQAGDHDRALENCRELVRLAPSLEHQCLLAEHLLGRGLGDEARTLLERSLQDYYYTPGPLRRRNRRWASQARRLQKRVAAR